MEIKDFFNLLGYTPEDSENVKIDDVKKHIADNFVSVNQIGDRMDLVEPLINKAYGKRMKEMELDLIKMAKGAGLDIKHSEVEELKIDGVMNKIQEKYSDHIKSLEEKVKKTPDSEKLQSQIEDWKLKYNQMQESVTKVQNDFDSYKNDIEEGKKKSLINQAKDKAINSVKFSSEVTDIVKKGFLATFNEKYKFALGESNEIELRDKDNKRVQNPDNLSKWLTPEEAAHRLAKEEGLLPKNPDDGKKVQTTTKKPEAEQKQVHKRAASPRMGVPR